MGPVPVLVIPAIETLDTTELPAVNQSGLWGLDPARPADPAPGPASPARPVVAQGRVRALAGRAGPGRAAWRPAVHSGRTGVCSRIHRTRMSGKMRGGAGARAFALPANTHDSGCRRVFGHGHTLNARAG